MSSSLSLFCRLALGFLFLYSFAAKARDLPRFRSSVTAFRLLPGRLAGFAALLVVTAELTAGALLLAGGPALGPGYGLAAALLALFTGVLVLALQRRPGVGCGCFGRDERPVAPADLVRNAGLLALVALGWWTSPGLPAHPVAGEAARVVVLTLAALSFLLFWTQLAEIVELLGRGTWGRPVPASARPAPPPGPTRSNLSKEVSP